MQLSTGLRAFAYEIIGNSKWNRHFFLRFAHASLDSMASRVNANENERAWEGLYVVPPPFPPTETENANVHGGI